MSSSIQLKHESHVQLVTCAAGNAPTDVQPYETGKAIAFMVLIGFTGIFSVTALRKIFIIDYKLAYPSGTATGVLINSLHTPAGEKRVSYPTGLLSDSPLFCTVLLDLS